VWSFTANAGDSFILRMGEMVNGSTLTPVLWLYGPNGVLLDSESSGNAAAHVTFRATNSGTFTVIAGDFSGGYAGSGTYRLTLAKTGEPIVISSGDEGGPLTNAVMHLGTIQVGDLDVWSFTASAGENLIVRMGETVSSTLTPLIWLYGPNGVLLDFYNATLAAEVSFRATNSGTFTVVAGDFSGGYGGSGSYRLTLAKTGSSIVVSAGDEGGPLNGSLSYDGTNDVGDLDIYFFTACVGEPLSLRMDELLAGSSLTPWLRLYGRDGVLIRSVSGVATAQFAVIATNTGVFTIVASDGSGTYGGSGGYRLTANALIAGVRFCNPIISGTNLVMGVVGGRTNATFVLFTETNITTPVALWSPVLTNQFDSFGVFSRTSVLLRTEPKRFYELQQQ
jgi:hypothetical protein